MSSIYKQSHSRHWWIKYRDSDGTLKRQSLRTPHRGKALKLQDLIDKRIRQDQSLRPPSAGLQAQIEKYLAQKKGSVCHRHHSDLRQRIANLLATVNVTEACQITPESVQNGLYALKVKNRSPSTIRNHLVALRGFCAFLVARGILIDNPCQHPFTMPKLQNILPRYLRQPEYDQCLALAQQFDIYLPVLTALKTGMRMSELRFMDWRDIHFSKNLIVIPKTKSNRPRSIPLHPELKKELLVIAIPKGPVFRGQRGGFVGEKQWRTLLKPIQDAMPVFREGRKGVGTAWHLFRSTFATRLVMAGTPLPKVQKWLGHRDLATTQRYICYSPDVYDEDIGGA